MTPKEKAIDILNKYSMWLINSHKEEVKQCAIICCDEIINELTFTAFSVIDRYGTPEQILYFKEVKAEIEKL